MEHDLLDDNHVTTVRFYYDLKLLRNITLITLAVGCFLFVLRIIFLFIVGGMIDQLGGSNGMDEFTMYANTVDYLDQFASAFLVLGMIPFFMWLYRAYYNLENVQQKGLSVTAGWAVGWFFIPFANIFYYDVVIINELVKGTKHIHVGNSPSQSCKNMSEQSYGLMWVLAWILAAVTSRIADTKIQSGTVEGLKSGIYYEAASNVFYILSGVVFFYVVAYVSKMQKEIGVNEKLV